MRIGMLCLCCNIVYSPDSTDLAFETKPNACPLCGNLDNRELVEYLNVATTREDLAYLVSRSHLEDRLLVPWKDHDYAAKVVNEYRGFSWHSSAATVVSGGGAGLRVETGSYSSGRRWETWNSAARGSPACSAIARLMSDM